MIFISPQFSSGFPATNDVSMHNTSKEIQLPVINQVDLASTISVLMDVPVPEKNLGTLIFPVITDLINSSAAVLNAVCKLASQLKRTLPLGSVRDRLTEAQKLSCSLNEVDAEMKDAKALLEVCREAAETLSSASSDYGIVSMSFALLLLTSLVTLLLFMLLRLSPSFFAQCHPAVFIIATFHVFSLCSSSFVEEEHQLWYYWIPLSYAVLLAGTRKTDLNYGSQVATLGVLFVLHRVLREWNRTGDKWAHLPDIEGWIRQ